MYEKVEFNQLVKGERYFIRYSSYKWITGKFHKYEQTDNNGIHALFKRMKKNNSWMYKGFTWHMTEHSSYYKCITNKEYIQKLKDKYDEKVLKIILKRIVNEDFEWN
jgi:hypothetical protein